MYNLKQQSKKKILNHESLFVVISLYVLKTHDSCTTKVYGTPPRKVKKKKCRRLTQKSKRRCVSQSERGKGAGHWHSELFFYNTSRNTAPCTTSPKTVRRQPHELEADWPRTPPITTLGLAETRDVPLNDSLLTFVSFFFINMFQRKVQCLNFCKHKHL